MKLITRNTDYALRALASMAKHTGEIVSVSELVRELKIPKSFLRKLLQILHKKRFLLSFKGKGGGFKLALTADEIFLFDIMNIFQGKFRLSECFLRKHPCPNINQCHLRKKIDKIEKYVIEEFKLFSVQDLLK